MGCVPSSLPIQSLKQRVYTRGTFTTGVAASNFFGYVIADPVQAVANDTTSIISTVAGYASTLITNSAGANTTTAKSNSNFASTTFSLSSLNNQQRTVGSLLRVRYAGTELNMGGTYTVLSQPEHRCSVGSDVTQLGADVTAVRMPITKDWVNVWYFPALNADTQFTNPNFQDPTLIGNTTNAFYMTIAANTAVAGQNFEYEHWTVYEVIGNNTRGATRSHADPNALAIGATIMVATPPAAGNIPKHEKNFIDKAFEYLRSGITGVTSVIGAGVSLATAAKAAQPYLPMFLA